MMTSRSIRTVAPAEAASKATSEAGGYLQSKLRNAEVLESMGMVHNLRPHWQERHEGARDGERRRPAYGRHGVRRP